MPPSEPPARAQRRTSGARVEASERITLRAEGFETRGWTLNVGRGGVRVVLEERIETSREYELFFSDDATGRRVQVAWSQEQADGQIAGLKYLDVEAAPNPEGNLSSDPPGDEPTAPGTPGTPKPHG
jgi:hypothetical protein